MARWAAMVVLLMLGASAAYAQSFAEEFVTVFRSVCLNDKPLTEALFDAIKSGRLQKPARADDNSAVAASTRMRPAPEGWRDSIHGAGVPVYYVGYFGQTEHTSNGATCYAGLVGGHHYTRELKPIVDQLHELAQPAGVMSAEERSRFGHDGPKFTDPAWHVLSAPDSVVVLYYSEHMWGGTSLVRIERRQ